MTTAFTRGYVLSLTAPERDFLLRILNERFKDLGIEIHRTDSLTYRESLIHEEAILHSLIDKATNSAN